MTSTSTVNMQPDIVQVATGLSFTEGPLWSVPEGALYFCDIRGDATWRWSGNAAELLRQPSGGPNGLAWDRLGRLVTCEAATARVTALAADGSVSALASHYGGMELNSPNDLVGRSDGSIYFTDPDYGRIGYPGFPGTPRPPELPFQGVFRIPPDGGLELMADGNDKPNGICFSRDESRLYVVETALMRIRAYDVSAGGRLSGERVFFTYPARPDLPPGVPDGIETDVLDNVYCTGPGGVWVISPEGGALGVIRLPERTANIAWGGADRRSLFATASTSVYRMEMEVSGNPPPYPQPDKQEGDLPEMTTDTVPKGSSR
jgi:gluconolactonase